MVSAIIVNIAPAAAPSTNAKVPAETPVRNALPMMAPRPVATVIEDHITINVKDQIAIKTYTCTFFNPNASAVVGGTCYMEVEPGAQVDRMSLRMGEKEVEAEILDSEKAKKVFQQILAKGGSPALLEFYGNGLIRAQVPRIPPNGKVTAVLRYTTILKSENGLFKCRVLNAI